MQGNAEATTDPLRDAAMAAAAADRRAMAAAVSAPAAARWLTATDVFATEKTTSDAEITILFSLVEMTGGVASAAQATNKSKMRVAAILNWTFN